MACPNCERRSALVAALAPAISRLSFTRESLLELLALPDERLLRAAKIRDPGGFLRGLHMPVLTDSVPTSICRHDRSYPLALRQLPSAPAVLYATCTSGRLRELRSKPRVAILGSRDCTGYARERTFELAHDLTQAGVTVISGVNQGVEGMAQHGVQRGGGHAIAVMAQSPDLTHRFSQTHLHKLIRTHGAAISEFPPGFRRPKRWCFTASQRIIAALASVLVVVEVGERSCALLTAKIGADLGAEIAVVPGRVTDPGGKWACALLRDGARPVACAEDVLELIDGDCVRAVAA